MGVEYSDRLYLRLQLGDSDFGPQDGTVKMVGAEGFPGSAQVANLVFQTPALRVCECWQIAG